MTITIETRRTAVFTVALVISAPQLPAHTPTASSATPVSSPSPTMSGDMPGMDHGSDPTGNAVT